jgi:hypothetical protein
MATSAVALSKPVTVGTGVNLTSSPPSVSVDASGDALIAWDDTENQTTSGDVVRYCVEPPGATGCSHAGSLAPAGAAQFIDGVHSMVDGSTMIVLADVFGAAGGLAFEPEQEWQSTDGGATWSPADAGLSVANGIINAGTQPLGGVIVPGTGVLGFGWDTAFGPPTFSAFPLSGAPECSNRACAAGFATLQPATDPNQLGNVAGGFASIPSGPLAGVMGAFDDLSPIGPCPRGGTAFVYGSGSQSASNDYNVSPGQPNSAWRVPLRAADCNAANSAVGGGPSGFGILEASGSRVVYHRFDAATNAFDTPLVTVDGNGQGELYPALSQDGTGGIYATYLLTPSGKPLTLAYSADGGRTFSLAPIASGSASIAQATSSVNANGRGWAAWIENNGSGNNTGSMLAEPFRAADTVLPPSLVGSPILTATRVTVDLAAPSYPAVFSLVISAPETVVTHHKRRIKIVTLAKSSFTTVPKGEGVPTSNSGQTVTLNFGAREFSYHPQLSGVGQEFLRARSGHVVIHLAVTETAERISTRLSRAIMVTLKHHVKR